MPNLSNIIGLGVATIFLAAIVGYAVWRGLAAIRRVGTFFLIFAVGMAFYGGSKGFRPVQFPLTDMEVAYLTDSGSRVTSNAVHLAFSASAMMPSDAEIYLDYRDAESTNDAEWVTYTNATLATFPNPLDFEFPDAISNVWQCYTTWTPGATVLTNGIVRIGWMLPTDGRTNTVLMLRTAIKTPTAADYVQDGLIAMWDGIENAGWGVNDKSVRYLQELVGGTRTITTNAYRVWSAAGDSLEVPADAPNNAAAYVNNIISSTVVTNAQTVEIVAYKTADDYNSSTNAIATFPLWWCNSSYNGFAIGIGKDVEVGKRLYCAIYVDNTNKAKYVSTAKRSGSGIYGQNGGYTWTNNLRIFSKVQNNVGFHAGICAIRIYSRLLTAEELDHNCDLDRARFKLPPTNH